MKKKSILLVHTVFCPDENQYSRFIDALINTDIYLKITKNFDRYNIYLMLIGWFGSKNIFYQFSIFKKIYIESTEFKLVEIYHEDNKGKYYYFNEIINYLKINRFDYVWYSDHDIYPNINILDNAELDKIFDYIDRTNSCIILNQIGDCRHQMTVYENIFIDKSTNLILCWTSSIMSYAAGSFIIDAHNFCKITKLPLISVYGLDDYYLFNKFKENSISVVMVDNFKVCHPDDIDIEYTEWKEKHVKSIITKKPVYDKEVEYSKIWWLKKSIQL